MSLTKCDTHSHARGGPPEHDLRWRITIGAVTTQKCGTHVPGSRASLLIQINAGDERQGVSSEVKATQQHQECCREHTALQNLTIERESHVCSTDAGPLVYGAWNR